EGSVRVDRRTEVLEVASGQVPGRVAGLVHLAGAEVRDVEPVGGDVEEELLVLRARPGVVARLGGGRRWGRWGRRGRRRRRWRRWWRFDDRALSQVTRYAGEALPLVDRVVLEEARLTDREADGLAIDDRRHGAPLAGRRRGRPVRRRAD